MLTGLNHLTLAVADLSRSFDFYRDILCFRPRVRWDCGANLTLGDLWLCLSLDERRAQAVNEDYTHYAFSVAKQDFPTLIERLGRQCAREWKDNRSEGDSIYFLDPDDHRLEAHVGDLDTRLAFCRLKPYAGMQFFRAGQNASSNRGSRAAAQALCRIQFGGG